MVTPRRRRFVAAQVVVLLGIAVALVTLDALTYDLFFLLSLVGFLLVVEYTAPFTVTPRWRRRLRWLVAAGLLGYCWLVAWRMIRILPEGAL